MDMNGIEDDFPSFGSTTAEPPDSPNNERRPHDLQPELQEQEDPAATQRDGRHAQQSVPPGEVLYHPVGDTVAGSRGLPGDGGLGGPTFHINHILHMSDIFYLTFIITLFQYMNNKFQG
jgi:hypothetical protein